MKNCDLLLLTGAVTGLWDIAARLLAENDLYDFPIFGRQGWLVALQPYFEKKTVLGAALLAGFVGLVSQWIILSIAPFPTSWTSKTLSQTSFSDLLEPDMIRFIVATLFVSGTIGIVMDEAGLFPDLSATYSKDLGRPRSIITDTVSGIIVQTTILALVKMGLFHAGRA